MFTLWIFVFGYHNAAGGITPYAGVPSFQPMATYRTEKECLSARSRVLVEVLASPASGEVSCLPTGVTDPVSHSPTPPSSDAK